MPSEVVLHSRFNEIAVALPARCAADETAVAEQVAIEAKARAPRLEAPIQYPSFQRTPGFMAEHIEVREARDSGKEVVVDAFYGRFVEEGTTHMEAQPFLRPAAEGGELELETKVTETLRSL